MAMYFTYREAKYAIGWVNKEMSYRV